MRVLLWPYKYAGSILGDEYRFYDDPTLSFGFCGFFLSAFICLTYRIHCDDAICYLVTLRSSFPWKLCKLTMHKPYLSWIWKLFCFGQAFSIKLSLFSFSFFGNNVENAMLWPKGKRFLYSSRAIPEAGPFAVPNEWMWKVLVKQLSSNIFFSLFFHVRKTNVQHEYLWIVGSTTQRKPMQGILNYFSKVSLFYLQCHRTRLCIN